MCKTEHSYFCIIDNAKHLVVTFGGYCYECMMKISEVGWGDISTNFENSINYFFLSLCKSKNREAHYHDGYLLNRLLSWPKVALFNTVIKSDLKTVRFIRTSFLFLKCLCLTFTDKFCISNSRLFMIYICIYIYIHALWWETLNETERSEYEVRKIILNWILKKQNRTFWILKWIYLIKGSIQWRDFVNKVMNVRILGNLLNSCETIMSFENNSAATIFLVSGIHPVYTELLILPLNKPQIC